MTDMLFETIIETLIPGGETPRAQRIVLSVLSIIFGFFAIRLFIERAPYLGAIMTTAVVILIWRLMKMNRKRESIS
jgi:hypothetical protein